VEIFIGVGPLIAGLFSWTPNRQEDCMKAFQSSLMIMMLFAVAVSQGWADTLILKSGDRVTGSFDGGTEHVVKFRTSSGGVKEYDVLNVQQILFSNEQKSTVLPTTSAEPSSASNAVHTLPAGSKITIRMIDSIGMENQSPGSLFLASVDQSIMSGGVEVIPKGANVWGRVTDSNPPGLELTLIVVDGIPYSITTAEYSAGKSLNVPPETTLEFTLKEPLVIAARE
jgi:hypothetical protein